MTMFAINQYSRSHKKKKISVNLTLGVFSMELQGRILVCLLIQACFVEGIEMLYY